MAEWFPFCGESIAPIQVCKLDDSVDFQPIELMVSYVSCLFVLNGCVFVAHLIRE